MSNVREGAIPGKPGLRRRANGKVQVRYRDDSGNFKTRTFDGVREAEKWRRAQLASRDAGTHIDPSNRMTVSQYADEWLAAQSFSANTRQAVELRLRLHALPVLGGLQLRAVKPTTIKAWLRTLDSLAPSYARVILVNVGSIFSAAVEDGLIVSNPCRANSVRAPKVESRKVVPWTAEQALGLREALPERYRVLVTLGAGLGLRQGEAFALSPTDIDWLRGKVEVRRQVKIVGSRLVFGLPKGSKSRTVPLPDSIRDDLASYLVNFPAQEVSLPWDEPSGEPVTASLLVTSRESLPLNRNYINTHVWKPALQAAGIPPTRDNGSHSLRHFYASVLLDAGESIKAVSDYLGHTDAGFTLRTYTHLMPSSDARTRNAVDAALGVHSVSKQALASV